MDVFTAAAEQQDLFGPESNAGALPRFPYQRDFLRESDQQALVCWIGGLPLTPFEFHGIRGKRRIASFGLRYDYGRQALATAADFPAHLPRLRDEAAPRAGLEPLRIAQILVTEYAPGAPIGWHTDKPQFDSVLGISLMTPATLRFRRWRGDCWERASVLVEPGSIYMLSAEVRHE